MSFPRKGLRKITVDEQEYLWSAKGDDMFISLHISAKTEKPQILSAPFPYLQDRTEFNNGSAFLDNQFVITPYTVRQVIEYALKNGWRPFDGGSVFRIRGIEEKIDLRLDRNKEHQIKEKSNQPEQDNPITRP